jgi:hypothetical protein
MDSSSSPSKTETEALPRPETTSSPQTNEEKFLSTSTTRRVHFSPKPHTTRTYIPDEREHHGGRTAIQNCYRTLLVLSLFYFLLVLALFQQLAEQPPSRQVEGHLIPPKGESAVLSTLTLRDFLMDPAGIHLAMAPSFFGFYGYFGALAAWEEELSNENSTVEVLKEKMHGVAGASSGAMAAILLAAGVPPRNATDFCTTITLGQFADFPGLLTVFRGDRFQDIMFDHLQRQRPHSSLQLQGADIPVAVSGFDLQTFQGKLLTRGSMARAARESACFPFLFQPVGWVDDGNNYLFIDGGLKDTLGLMGLAAFKSSSNQTKRVVNLVIGGFHLGQAPGPSSMPDSVDASEVLSISIQNLPNCGPLAMENGPRAL